MNMSVLAGAPSLEYAAHCSTLLQYVLLNQCKKLRPKRLKFCRFTLNNPSFLSINSTQYTSTLLSVCFVLPKAPLQDQLTCHAHRTILVFSLPNTALNELKNWSASSLMNHLGSKELTLHFIAFMNCINSAVPHD